MRQYIYRMAALCFMAVITWAATAQQQSTILLRTNPAGVGYLETYNWQDGGWISSGNADNNTLHATVGNTYTFYINEPYGWIFRGLLTENGDTLTTKAGSNIIIPAGENHVFTAYFEYHPANPGMLPTGTYDRATATVTMEALDGNDGDKDSYYSFQQSYYMLADHYNLPRDRYSYEGTNPVETLHVIGNAGYEASCVGNLVYYLPEVRTVDVSELEGFTYVRNWWCESHSLTSLVLPSTIEEFSSYAFRGWSAIEEIYMPVAEPPYLTLDGDSYEVYTDSGTIYRYYNEITLYVPAESLEAYEAHESWSKFFLQPIAGRTATIQVNGINSWLFKGGRLTLTTGGASLSRTINEDAYNYVFENLETNLRYTISLTSADGEFVYADPIDTLLLTQDTIVEMQMREFSLTYAHVFAGEAEVTDQCAITWLNADGNKAYGIGSTSPVWPVNQDILIQVVPMGEVGTFFFPKDTIYRMEMASNGVWMELERKEIGQEDTTATRIALGGVHAIAYNAENAVGMLYDEQGYLVGKYSFVKNADFSEYEFVQTGFLPGEYTMIAMREGQYASVSRLDQLAALGLSEGVQYLRNDFEMVGDSIVEVLFRAIPDFEERDASYTTDATRFYANTAEVMAANNVQLTAEVEFDVDDFQQLTDMVYYIDLPENLSVVDGSVMVGYNAVSYTFYDHRLSVSVGMANLSSKEATRLRFYVVPTAPGEYYPSASVEYRYKGRTKMEPIGNTYFTAKAITLTAPQVVLEPAFEATGYAPANALVRIVTAQGDTIGRTNANARGFYRANCQFEATGTTTINIHACASTAYASRLVSDTTSVRYDAEAPRPNDCFMTHQNNWYHRPMDVTWNFRTCSTSVDYYYYYHGEDFSFSTNMSNLTDTLNFVVIGQDGSVTTIPATRQTNTKWVATHFFSTSNVPVRVDISYRYNGEMVYFRSCKNVRTIADPSGYVYEAVSSNRVEGVTASAYHKEHADSTEVLWYAEEFDQINPMQTDYAGAYAWDVPQGLWQVRFAKEGFEPAQTEWLPVPPPQLEINIPLTRLSAPTVKQISAFEDGVTIEFDRYMMPEDINTDMIHVTTNQGGYQLGGYVLGSTPANPIEGSFTLLNEEPRVAGDTITYVSKVKFVPAEGTLSGNLNIAFDTCRSYAGVPMVATTQPATVTLEVKNFGQIDTIHLTVDEAYQRTVYALPGAAAAGKTIRFDAMGTQLYSISADNAVIASDGSAIISFLGLVPGTTELRLSVDGTDLVTYVPVVVVPNPAPLNPTDITNVSSEDTNNSAKKFVKDGTIYIRLDGEVYTVTGVRVE